MWKYQIKKKKKCNNRKSKDFKIKADKFQKFSQSRWNNFDTWSWNNNTEDFGTDACFEKQTNQRIFSSKFYLVLSYKMPSEGILH